MRKLYLFGGGFNFPRFLLITADIKQVHPNIIHILISLSHRIIIIADEVPYL